MIPSKSIDINACGCLYDKYAPALFGVILKLTPDEQLANDILEKSFIKIFVELNDFEDTKSGLFILMLRITLQECINNLSINKACLSQLFILR